MLEQSRRPAAVVFDLNGTILDTEEAHWRAYHHALAEHGVDFSLEEFTHRFTYLGQGLHDILRDAGGPELLRHEDEIARKKAEYLSRELPTMGLMPGIFEVLTERLKDRTHLALESTSTTADVEAMLTQAGLSGCFEVLATGDMEARPDVARPVGKAARLRYVAQQLGVSPCECVVVGDAEKDVRAATENGMASVAIPNRFTSDQDFSSATEVLESATELTLCVLSRAVNRARRTDSR